MSTMHVGTPSAEGPPALRGPRVRDLARQAVALMAFSAATSVAVSLLLLLAYGLGR